MDSDLVRDIENYFAGQAVEPYEIAIYWSHQFVARSPELPDLCVQCSGPRVHHLLARALLAIKAT